MEKVYGILLLVLLAALVVGLVIKLLLLYSALRELQLQFAERLETDTNVGLDISTSDVRVRSLAADLDRQLKLLRKKHIRYMQGDQELKNAITNMSHDLRTPLTAICGYMDLLAEEEVSQKAGKYLEIIRQRVLTLKELTEELFRYSVVMADSYSKMEDLSLNRAVEECVAAYYGALKEAGIFPVIQMPEQDIYRQLNRQALSRILSNLVGNAIKYSQGDLKIILEENGKLHFENRAEMLDEVQVGHLFDRFYTVENGQHATGLGLSIAKVLTEDMKGHIGAVYQNGILRITVTFV